MDLMTSAVKSSSFARHHTKSRKNDSSKHESFESSGSKSEGLHLGKEFDERFMEANLNLTPVMEENSRFLDELSSIDDKSRRPEIPNSVESLASLVESLVGKYGLCQFGKNPEEDSKFVDAVLQISKLENKLGEFQFPSGHSCLSRLNSVLHRALFLLDGEFRNLLDVSSSNNNNNNNHNSNHSHNHSSDSKSPKAGRQSSFNANHESDRCSLQESEETFPGFSGDQISTLHKIAKAMISCGYEPECRFTYSIYRREAFKEEFDRIGFESVNTEDHLKMQWGHLEEEIAVWINTVKLCSSTIFPDERNLCESVFSDFPLISKRLYAELVSVTIMRLLTFPGAIVITKRSTERLFKFLDMYETLRVLVSGIDPSCLDDTSQELISEISIAEHRIGEAVVSIFCELENSIKTDNGRTPVPSGAVHPLTRYTMNYLKYACEYKDTLEQVFKQHLNTVGNPAWNNAGHEPERRRRSDNDNSNDDGTPKTSPFAVQLMQVMDLLDANLDKKSKLYRDPALRFIFLMNNGRYIWQKIKGSTEIHEMMGHSWTRKRSSDLRQYHKSYQRETWSRVLQSLSHDGLQVNGKVTKTVLKERFKSFNALFDDIHKTQSTWVVSDEQLQSELRISISAVVIPAYRSFLGRFKQYLDSSRQVDKYIKYQPEDIETLIDELFDGNPTSMGRRKEHK